MQFFWILILSLPASSGQLVQVGDGQVGGAPGVELAEEGQGSVSCKE